MPVDWNASFWYVFFSSYLHAIDRIQWDKKIQLIPMQYKYNFSKDTVVEDYNYKFTINAFVFYYYSFILEDETIGKAKRV